MKKYRKKSFISLLLVMAIIFSLTGCNKSGKETDAPIKEGETDIEKSDSADLEKPPTPENPLILKLCHLFSVGTIMDQATRMIAENVEKRTNGAIKIEVHTDGVLPVNADGMELCTRGAKYICHTDVSTLADWVPDYLALTGPFMVDTEEEFQKLCDTETVAEMNREAERHGAKVLAIPFCFGFRQIGTKKIQIHSIDDLKGINFRVPNSKAYFETFNALGCNTLSTTSADVYNAMQTGLADAHETSLADMVEMQMFEVDNYVTISKHFVAFDSSVMSADVFNSLSPEQQDIMMEEFQNGAKWCTKKYQEYDIESRKIMEDKGVKFIDDMDLEPFKEATKVYYTNEVFPEMTPGIYEKLQAELRTIRSSAGK